MFQLKTVLFGLFNWWRCLNGPFDFQKRSQVLQPTSNAERFAIYSHFLPNRKKGAEKRRLIGIIGGHYQGHQILLGFIILFFLSNFQQIINKIWNSSKSSVAFKEISHSVLELEQCTFPLVSVISKVFFPTSSSSSLRAQVKIRERLNESIENKAKKNTEFVKNSASRTRRHKRTQETAINGYPSFCASANLFWYFFFRPWRFLSGSFWYLYWIPSKKCDNFVARLCLVWFGFWALWLLQHIGRYAIGRTRFMVGPRWVLSPSRSLLAFNDWINIEFHQRIFRCLFMRR